MKSALKITLKPGEKLYLNGAVIRSDRKVSLEFLNDVQFLLESHVLQADNATTPLKQLYFVIQLILISPKEADQARAMLRRSLPQLMDTFTDPHVLSELKLFDRLVGEDHVFEALKVLRALFPIEAAILDPVLADRHFDEQPMLAAGE